MSTTPARAVASPAASPSPGSTPVDPAPGAGAGAEPWFALEPLPPLDRILPAHFAYVRSVVARFRVSPAHWREDLVQQTLLEAHRSRASRLDTRALLFGITRHMVFRWAAKRRAERAVAAQLRQAGPVTDHGAEDDRREAERRRVVWTAIDELPGAFREVFLRTQLRHMTMPEVARELGISVNTGYTRLHLARACFVEALRRALARGRVPGRELL